VVLQRPRDEDSQLDRTLARKFTSTAFGYGGSVPGPLRRFTFGALGDCPRHSDDQRATLDEAVFTDQGDGLIEQTTRVVGAGSRTSLESPFVFLQQPSRGGGVAKVVEGLAWEVF